MNRFLRFLFVAAGILAVISDAKAQARDALDAEGYPVMFVRGNDIDNWACNNDCQFTRDGDKYTLKLASLTGEFKISGTAWQYNLGSKTKADGIISASTVVTGYQNGENMTASNLKDVEISFTLSKGGSGLNTTQIAIVVGGVTPPVSGMSGTLPVLYVNVYLYDDENKTFYLDANGNKILDNEIIDRNLSHKNYFNGEYWLDVNGCQWLIDEGAESVGSEADPLPLQIKARGNYTRKAFSKKPFKLKLDKKKNLLNININGKTSKHWAILAHADDNKGYLRNFTGFALGERIGLPWTPRQQPVEVVINGDYRGLYFLTESIRVGDGRVPVEELDDNVSDPALVSGGYIVELDNYDEENQIRMPEKGNGPGYKDMLRVTFDTPEVYSELQRRFITDQFTAINDCIGDNSDKLWEYVDLDDFARYYIVEEIISHTESFHGSTYLFRDRGEGQKWHFSPLWDCGNAFNGSTTDFFYNGSPFGNTWIPSVRLNDTFNAKVKETWQWFMGKQGGFAGLEDDINAYCTHIAEAAKADAARWQGQPVPADGQSVSDNSDMERRRQTVLKHLDDKINWLAKQKDFGAINTDTPEPERDTTVAAPLPEYADVEFVPSDEEDVPAVYYDLMGRRVANPSSGNFYIVRRGEKVTKEVISF